MAKWEKDIAAYEAADRNNPPPNGCIVFVGSSSIRKWTSLAKDFPGKPVINRGFGGSQITDSVAFASRIVLPYHPKQVIIYAGDNDIGAGKSPEQVLSDFRAFVSVLHKVQPDLPIGFIAIKPSIKRWNLVDKVRAANRLIAVDCRKDKRLTFIDIENDMLGGDGMPNKALFVADGLHMTPEGYEVWTRRVKPLLK